MNRFPVVSILAAFVLVAGCSPSPRHRVAVTLDDVESYIDARPDSALAVLRALDADSLRGPGQRARAALLHQMALDKCYIDITSDSVLSPAFWYLKHGNADQKLKTWYYRSVLARNAGDIDTQMLYLVRGEQYIPRAKDPLMAGFVYTAMRVVYLHIYDVDDATRSAEQAVEAFRQAGDMHRHNGATISLANLYNLRGRYDESGRLLDTLTSRWETLTPRQQKMTARVRLDQLIETGPASQVAPFVERYLQETPASEVDWVLVARAHLAAGDAGQADMALSRTKLESLNEDEVFSYLRIREDVLRALGKEAEALEVSREHRRLLDASVDRGLSSRARFLAEEQRLYRARVVRSWWMAGLALLAFLLCGWVWLVSRDRTKHRQIAFSLQGRLERVSRQMSSLKQRAKEAEREVKALHALLEQERLPDEVSRLISDRVSALNEYTFAQVTKSDRQKALEDLATTLSRERQEQFLDDLTLQYGYLHPGFARFLGQYRLTGQEKSFCTLLAMGRDTKEIAQLTGLSVQRCYNIFYKVRRKMRLLVGEGDLTKLFREKVNEL